MLQASGGSILASDCSIEAFHDLKDASDGSI